MHLFLRAYIRLSTAQISAEAVPVYWFLNTNNLFFWLFKFAMWALKSYSQGAPNENIVQKHLNIALLNVFFSIGIFLSPKNFSSVRIF